MNAADWDRVSNDREEDERRLLETRGRIMDREDRERAERLAQAEADRQLMLEFQRHGERVRAAQAAERERVHRLLNDRTQQAALCDVIESVAELLGRIAALESKLAGSEAPTQ